MVELNFIKKKLSSRLKITRVLVWTINYCLRYKKSPVVEGEREREREVLKTLSGGDTQAGVEPQDMITIFFTANKTFNIIQSLEKVTLKYDKNINVKLLFS